MKYDRIPVPLMGGLPKEWWESIFCIMGYQNKHWVYLDPEQCWLRIYKMHNN